MSLSLTNREPGSGFTPLMEASASGHEIIIQYLLDHVSRRCRKTFSYFPNAKKNYTLNKGPLSHHFFNIAVATLTHTPLK